VAAAAANTPRAAQGERRAKLVGAPKVRWSAVGAGALYAVLDIADCRLGSFTNLAYGRAGPTLPKEKPTPRFQAMLQTVLTAKTGLANIALG